MSYNPFTLQGKTILITGASSGIGKTTAMECAKAGARLVITGRDPERLHRVFSQLKGEGHKWLACDLADPDALTVLVSEVPALDGVLFCAGITDTILFKFITKEKIDRIFDVNLFAPILLTKELIAKKKLNKLASLVYISSTSAKETLPGLGIYSASKRGLNAIMQTVALELAPRKIRSNSILPGMVRTELFDKLSSITEEDLAKDETRYPLGYGRPEDVAYAAIYLLSDASRWMTGSELRIDGGSTL